MQSSGIQLFMLNNGSERGKCEQLYLNLSENIVR